MKLNPLIIFVSTGCFIFFSACAGKDINKTEKKLQQMSDRELISHYEMLNMRMVDIDRAAEQAVKYEQDMSSSHYPLYYQNHLGHLHIGDSWSKLQKERKLTRIELRKRGISPESLSNAE